MGLVIRQTVKGSIANYIGVAFGFINILFLMPLIFEEEELGLLRMLIDNHVALAGFAMMGITSSMYRYFPNFKSDPSPKMHGFHFWALLVPFVGFVVVSLILVTAKSYIVDFFSENAAAFLEYYLLLIPLAFSHIFFGVFETISAIEGRIVVPKLLKEVVIRLLTATVFLAYYAGWISFHQSIGVLVLSYFIPLFAIMVYVGRLRKLQLQVDWRFLKQNPDMVKDFVRYTSLITIGSISGLLLAKLDQIMISSQMGLDFSGIYVLAFHAAMVIEVPRRALIQMIQPKVSELMKDGQTIEVEKLYKRTSMLLYIPGLFLLLGLLINIDNLYLIMPNGENYVSGKDVLILIAIAKAIEMTTCMGQIVIMYSKFYYVLFLMTVGTSILGIYLNLWLIPSYGIFGAAIATFIALMIQQIIIIVSIYVKLKIHSFTLPMLWLTLLFVAILGLNSLLPPFSNHWVDALVRTLIMLSLFVFILFKLQINQEANRLILLIIKRIKSGNFKPS